MYRAIDKILEERHEVAVFAKTGNVEAQIALASDLLLTVESPCEKWVKVVWFPSAGCGKMITFKAGSPYEKKTGKRKDGENITDEAREARRLSQSLSRTRKRIFEIAASNDWEWFFTGTLDGEKCDRNDLNTTFKAISQFIRDYRKTGAEVKYMIVPEQHKNGSWHFHGLISGLPEERLHKFEVTEKLPYRILNTIKSGTDVFTWIEYANKFGYSTLTRVRDRHAVACYVTKYITKDMIKNNAALGTRRHLYYASLGLCRPEVLAESFPALPYTPSYDFENEWCEIRDIKTREEAEVLIARYGLQRGDVHEAWEKMRKEVEKCQNEK